MAPVKGSTWVSGAKDTVQRLSILQERNEA